MFTSLNLIGNILRIKKVVHASPGPIKSFNWISQKVLYLTLTKLIILIQKEMGSKVRSPIYFVLMLFWVSTRPMILSRMLASTLKRTSMKMTSTTTIPVKRLAKLTILSPKSWALNRWILNNCKNSYKSYLLVKCKNSFLIHVTHSFRRWAPKVKSRRRSIKEGLTCVSKTLRERLNLMQ